MPSDRLARRVWPSGDSSSGDREHDDGRLARSSSSSSSESESNTHRRKKRSVSVERNVETLVVVDQSMVEYYKNEDLENYVLTIMNMVSDVHSIYMNYK